MNSTGSYRGVKTYLVIKLPELGTPETEIDRIWSEIADSGGIGDERSTTRIVASFDLSSEAVQYALNRTIGNRPQDRQPGYGIHMGEVKKEDDIELRDSQNSVVGLANILSKMANPGQILLSREVFEISRHGMDIQLHDRPLTWQAHGPYLIQGLAEPEEIFEVSAGESQSHRSPVEGELARSDTGAADKITLGWRPGAGIEVPDRPGWVLEKKLGEGGFGEVWTGRSSRTQECRTFKFCFKADRLRTLQRELTLFRLMKEVLGERPDIARLYDVRLDEAPYYLEMEYTPGGDLVDWSEGQGGIAQVSLEDRIELVAQLADALSAAHSVGVIHKDVKPRNVLIEEKKNGEIQARLTDFGIGTLLTKEQLEEANLPAQGFTTNASTVRTELGSRTGTRLYMAPELFAHGLPSVQSDIYALGVILFQIVVGDLSRPLGQGWERDIDNPLIREDIEACLDVDPDRRLTSASILSERLRSLDERLSARKMEQAHKASQERARRRNRFLLASAPIGTFLILVLSVFSFLEGRRADRESTLRAQAEDARAIAVQSQAEAESARAQEAQRAEELRVAVTEATAERARADALRIQAEVALEGEKASPIPSQHYSRSDTLRSGES